MDQYLSRNSKSVIINADRIAKNVGKSYLDTEHLLLALTEDELIQQVFEKLNISANKITEKTKLYIGSETITPPFTQSSSEYSIELSPRAKQTLNLAFNEAQSLGHAYIGPEHILLGILREGEGLGYHIMQSENISYDQAKETIIKIIGEGERTEKKSDTPTLDKFSRDLTNLAKAGKIDPVIGRSKEINRVIQTLSRRRKNNPVLIGEPGVGKTAIAEGLALRIINDNVPEVLNDKRVLALDIGSLIAGTKFQGEFEDRATKIIKEIEAAGNNVILFIDELHTIVGSGAMEGKTDLSNLLKPALARGDMQMIGATTLSEYKKYIEKDAALERRFQPVNVSEPSISESIEILEGLRDKYEAHHKIKISEDAIIGAVELSEKYINERFLPDKAIDILDEAASMKRLNITSEPDEIREIKVKISNLEKERESLTRHQKHEESAKIKQEIERLKEELKPLEEKWMRKRGTGSPELTLEDVANVVSSMTGIPANKINIKEKKMLKDLEKLLHKRVIGQENAIEKVSEAIRQARLGLADDNRPLASFIFLGPTGVGKTELAKTLAEVIFGSENNMIRLDMSEYMEKHSVAKIIGSPPGYIGFEEGGQLTEKVRRNPYTVILLDEIEKAHPDVSNILLQILEDGILSDAHGKKVSFKNAIIIATSNIASNYIHETDKPSEEPTKPSSKLIKFQKEQKQEEDRYTYIMRELKKFFRIELINRFDDVIIFNTLSNNEIDRIVKMNLENLKLKLKKQNIKLEYDEDVSKFIAQNAYSSEFGAREIRRFVQKNVVKHITEFLLEKNKSKNIKLKLKDERIVIG